MMILPTLLVEMVFLRLLRQFLTLTQDVDGDTQSSLNILV